jgi:hypothetical protein
VGHSRLDSGRRARLYGRKSLCFDHNAGQQRLRSQHETHLGELPVAGVIRRRDGGGESAVAEDGVPDLGEVVLDLLGLLAVTLGGRLDAQCPQQVGRWPARIAGLPEDRVQALRGEVLKHQVDHAPGVEGLVAESPWLAGGLAVGCPWLIHGTIISPGCRLAEGCPT